MIIYANANSHKLEKFFLYIKIVVFVPECHFNAINDDIAAKTVSM